MNQLLVLLLPLAAFSGWWLARSDKKSDDEQKADDYFKGLGYLLEDKTDQAIDIFVQIARLDDTTIENQITLGNLFRYRGEIDRALHIHSTLADKGEGELTPLIAQKLDLALANDYLAAGIMNHAEAYYLAVSKGSHPDMRDVAYRQLIQLYSEQALWEKAIEIAETLDPFKRDAVQKNVAHFYCEIAKNALENHDEEKAISALNTALTCDKNCVRATLKLGRLAAQKGNHVTAINHFTLLEKQNPAFLPEILGDLSDAYTAVNQQHEWATELKRLAKTYQNPVLVLRYNELVAKTEGIAAAQQFLQKTLESKPNILTIQAYLNLIRDEATADASTDEKNHQNNHHSAPNPSHDNYSPAELQLLKTSVNKVLAHTLKYRCSECGFRGNVLNWQCPGCKQWGTFMPVSDVSLKESVSS